jgi:glycerophosphoryl diester phosphodiesterase
MKVIGHRGAMGYEPENTLRSIRKALELGVDAIEVDVFVLPTGELVVTHDLMVDRTTNGHGYVADLSFSELRALDAGKGERIPTLAEVVSEIDQRVPLMIELKGFGVAAPVAHTIKQFLRRGWQADRFIVVSYNHHELKGFKTLMPHIGIGACIEALPLDYAAFAEELHASAIAPANYHMTKEFVDDAHRRGLAIYVWFYDQVDHHEIHRLEKIGVDFVYSDAPDQTRELISRAYSASSR